MRHNNKINHLGRTYSHRASLLSNMAVSLIMHKRIFTTLAKAKELRKYVEPLITKSKTDTTHSRRIVFRELQNKYAVTELFKDVAQKISDRPGGYTRIIKTGNRLGDNAEMCFIELVDYNELMLKSPKKASGKTRRSRRSSGKPGVVEPIIPVMPHTTEKPFVHAEVEKEPAEALTETSATVELPETEEKETPEVSEATEAPEMPTTSSDETTENP
jgi:large subunit ribosomal protein L17